MQKRAAAELSESAVVAGKKELLKKLLDEGILSNEQFEAQQTQVA